MFLTTSTMSYHLPGLPGELLTVKEHQCPHPLTQSSDLDVVK